ncbi:LCP family protein [Frankia sp. Cppng1_Ct_nod]|uniref:LCP family protein n=1 Tax=Frankia sp. Cppng1_Ct_nod TaxID=2897162 RepID=UPI0010412B22|nr:LCP family protein [Frankia sp. Cppng1_Ct_nod]
MITPPSVSEDRSTDPEQDATGSLGTTDTPRSRSLTHKLLLTLAALLSLAILTVSTGGYVIYRYFDAQINRVVLGLGGDRPADAVPGTENFLLVGSDSRAGTGNEYQSEGVVAGERSDTTILAHLDADGTTTLVSFPRDTFVGIPGHGRDKLNAAITIGGPSLLIKTIESLTDIKIDHFVSIDLAGFKAMTDAIGGVTVCVKPLPNGSTSNLHDQYSQWHGVIGENHLNGEQALSFVRQRYGLPNGDFDRIRRQQQFISTVFRKATSSGVLTNPARLEGLLAAATGALTVDDATTVDDLRNLATRLRAMSSDTIRFETIPVREPTVADGANSSGELGRYGSVQLYNPAELETFLAPLRGHGSSAPGPSAGSPTPGAPGPSAQPAVSPSSITVNVLNGTTTGGLATSTAKELAAAGFRARAEGSADRRAATSLVRYNPDALTAARTVAAAVPGAQLREDPSLGTAITLVVGADFDGVDAAAVTAGSAAGGTAPGNTGSTRTAPTPLPTATATPLTATELTEACTF